MGKLVNHIVIKAPLEKVWDNLSDAGRLAKYDPTIRNCTVISANRSGIGAKRKIDMLDGKNWFEEKVTVYEPHKALSYQLTDCSFPIKGLKHSYSFENLGNNNVRVTQVMEYAVKFGLLGRLMDVVMMRKQFDSGIKKFFNGLKTFTEKQDQ